MKLSRSRLCPKELLGGWCVFSALALLLVQPSCSSTPEVEVDPSLWERDPGTAQGGTTDVRKIPLRAGDEVEVFVLEDDSFSGSYAIRETGHVIMPQLGRIMLAGLTPPTAEQRIKSKLEDGVLTEATVILDRLRSSRVPEPLANKDRLLVYTSGKVTRPGQHSLVVPEGRRMGVFEVVLITGGLEKFANERRAYILRAQGLGGRERIPVDLKAIREGSADDVPVLQGDIIVVPERTFGI